VSGWAVKAEARQRTWILNEDIDPCQMLMNEPKRASLNTSIQTSSKGCSGRLDR
jgi:hypothetical protein